MFALRTAARVAVRGYATEAVASGMRLTLTSPGGSFFNEQLVNQVNIPGSDGDFGVLPNHVPVIATLKPGVVSVISESNAEKRFFVSSGTATINADSSVQIIAEQISPVEDLDLSAAKKQLDAYNAKLNSSNELEKIEAEIAVEVYSAMVKALE
eukprot:m.63567 g.63567  ORF g.63567 m.63567 type:complete len:154 (+) comp13452_c0_seq1:266-727(+)